MNINGIIAEYNPFHNGHAYQLSQAKEAHNADYTIVVMSGNFTQRGDAAIVDKYTRTKMALQAGADLVLELPVLYATASAEYFAAGAVSLLDKLGIVTHLNFGSESGNIDAILRLAKTLSTESEQIQQSIQAFMKEGLSFPKAREKAYQKSNLLSEAELEFLNQPNHILGIEYCKALMSRNSSMQPTTITRIGGGYNDTTISSGMASARSIREALENRVKADTLSVELPDATLENTMPSEAYLLLKECIMKKHIVTRTDFSQALYYKLVAEEAQGYEKYLDVNKELSDRIRNTLSQFKDWDGFIESLKTKELTYTRISRCLLHILLNITKDQMALAVSMDHVPYARILGFRKNAAPLLTQIKEHSSIPMISKLADAEPLLDDFGKQLLALELFAGKIYRSAKLRNSICDEKYENEFSTPIVIL